MRSIQIAGTGMAVPAQATSSQQLDERLRLSPGTSLRQTGVRRRFLSTTETAAELAAQACRRAMEDAGLDWDDIDCIVAASATMDQSLPYNAALIHAELGLSAQRTTTFDINASCLSFLAALDTMSYLVEAGRYRHVLLVSSDIATFGINWSNLREGGIFGDGAAAAVIRRTEEGGESAILSSKIETLSKGVHHCRIPAGGSRYHPRRELDQPFASLTVFQMDGKSVFKLASEALPDFTDKLLANAGVRMKDLAAVVPHQASQLALTHLSRRLDISPRQLVNIFPDYGNQVGASLPTALHLCLTQGRAKRGDTIMMLGTGAGLTMGGMVLTL
ncbi:3-oxoacyl-[acyl-carrier-protein] synthase III C-terminal domain-containing protein [Pseudoduganella violaceinigra]|uniref:3-oxoacyl-[acyl-carrier-protein] synthase III C-terminal domain-containing protein n=1 Tax=Pseudoduganella violaceinigra TaxID=246602 RepID=UPI000482BE1B|nr:3-oxoacyl-[acyl-carrier-protein] synthase III C-terminal domain-containing protein [Pseudoduganella violaceinigra]